MMAMVNLEPLGHSSKLYKAKLRRISAMKFHFRIVIQNLLAKFTVAQL